MEGLDPAAQAGGRGPLVRAGTRLEDRDESS